MQRLFRAHTTPARRQHNTARGSQWQQRLEHLPATLSREGMDYSPHWQTRERCKNRYFKLLTRRSSVKWTGTWDVKTPRGEYKHIGSNVLWSEKQTRKFRSTYWPHLWGKTVRTLQLEIIRVLCVTPGFRRGVNEVCALLGRYAA